MLITDNKSNNFEYNGAIHIHTLCSDGTWDIEKISKSAKKNGLDWIIVTDHNNMDVQEGYINELCVIKGEEISPGDSNHYLALGIKEVISPDDSPSENIKSVHKQNGFGFMAHPFESKSRKNKNLPIRWSDKNAVGDGIELWNWFSDWADNYDESNILKIVYSYLFKDKLVKTPNQDSIDFWDKINLSAEKIFPAIFGIDAHALKITKYIIPVKIFPYEYMFKTFVNRLILPEKLSRNFEKDKDLILNALKHGNNILINQSNGKINSDFCCTACNKETKALCGEHIKLDNETFLNIKLNKKAQIRIFLNGKLIFEENNDCCKIKINETGKYRAEILKNKRGWIYTNPISVIT